MFHCEDFVFNNPYSFTDRFKGEDDYFGGKGTLYSDRVVETNFVADAIHIEPVAWTERGKGNATIFFEMSESMMGSRVSLKLIFLPSQSSGNLVETKRCCNQPYQRGPAVDVCHFFASFEFG